VCPAQIAEEIERNLLSHVVSQKTERTSAQAGVGVTIHCSASGGREHGGWKAEGLARGERILHTGFMGFVDIHSHILPALDDGSESLEQSVEMLRLAASTGTTDIVATPHANAQFAFDRERAQALLEELQAAAGPAPRLHLGCDCHLSHDNIQGVLGDPARYTINGAGYLLVEFSDFNIPPATEGVFASLRQAGVTPVVTHPERNPLLRQTPARLAAWVRSGVYLQVTAQSLTGGFGFDARDCALSLTEQGLVHIVASDAHDPVGRPPRLDLAHALLAKRFDAEFAELLCSTFPGAALAGVPLNPGPLTPPRGRKWYQFWR
jgi:protein-tyrosine phosphatase